MPEFTIPEALQLAQQWLLAGRAVDAEQMCRRILASGPRADALQMLSSALLKQNRRPEAADAIRALIQVDPSSFDAYYNLGLVMTPLDRDVAIGAYQQAIAIRPESTDALNNLADLLRQRGDAEGAAGLLEKALALRPDFVPARYNLALCRFQQERHAETEAMLRKLLAENPNLPDAWHALGNVLRTLNQPAEALTAYANALALKPDLIEARWHASLAMLTLGDFENGWPATEARRGLQSVWREPKFNQPEWRGEDLNGRRILLWTEQGFGDAIQFIRYAPMVTQRGGRVSVLCQPELLRLFRSIPEIEHLYASPHEAADFDLHAPLMNLPAIFKTTLDTVPGKTPYLSADPILVKKWAAKLPSGPKIGLAWESFGRERLIPASAFNPLGTIPAVTYCSLQKGGASTRPNFPLLDFTGDFQDFADTAAVIAQLDHVITCDTAVAHLAGALGKPTSIILPYTAPWRWLLDRSDTPWYPSVRLFRQPVSGDWNTPIAQACRAMQQG